MESVIVFVLSWLGLGFMFTLMFGDEEIGGTLSFVAAVCLAFMVSCEGDVEVTTKADPDQAEINRVVEEAKKKKEEKLAKQTTVEHNNDIKLYREAVKGCERAESRFRTYMYMGEPLDTAKKTDLEMLIEQCKEG